jgi:hypothetical protein
MRRHGPGGYQDYESYRDWIRDEFLFRCVYCLHRERWYGRDTTFNIEHFIPVAVDQNGKLEYANLLYSCATCNNAKRGIVGVPDPCTVAFGDCVRVVESGHIEALNEVGESLVKKLRLNGAKNVEFRFRLMRTLATLLAHNPELYAEFMAFPHDLPDLRTKNAPLNSRPESVEHCWFAMRERGELPASY